MIINPSKFNTMTINRRKKSDALQGVNINNQIIKLTDSVMLLGIEIERMLNFDFQLFRVCK